MPAATAPEQPDRRQAPPDIPRWPRRFPGSPCSARAGSSASALALLRLVSPRGFLWQSAQSDAKSCAGVFPRVRSSWAVTGPAFKPAAAKISTTTRLLPNKAASFDPRPGAESAFAPTLSPKRWQWDPLFHFPDMTPADRSKSRFLTHRLFFPGPQFSISCWKPFREPRVVTEYFAPRGIAGVEAANALVASCCCRSIYSPRQFPGHDPGRRGFHFRRRHRQAGRGALHHPRRAARGAARSRIEIRRSLYGRHAGRR